MQSVYIAIPAFQEEKKIGQVIKDILKCGYSNIVVADDGSWDNTAKVAQEAGAVVVRHKLNRGKGAATRTAIEAAIKLGASIVVTMDGDGQHFADDIKSLVAPIAHENYDVVLGYRSFSSPVMPVHKITHNLIANGISALYAGLTVKDSQSGFRAYSRFACQLLDTKADSYEYESEIIYLIGLHNLRFTEVPVAVAYTDYSQNKLHKQNITNGVKTVYKLIFNRLS